MSIKEKQIEEWINKCKTNIIMFKNEHNNMTDENKLQFIRTQYKLISIIDSVLIGKTKLVGVDTKKFHHD
jgi:hypothetical protein